MEKKEYNFVQEAPPGKKKKKHTVLKVFVALFVIGAISFVVLPKSGAPQIEDAPVAKVFDASTFLVTGDDGTKRPMTEAEVIGVLGDPENAEDWNYSFGGSEYPVRSLSYHGGDYTYEFYNDQLARIQIFAPATFVAKDDIPELYNLGGGSVIVDTATTYRVENCGVHDLWCTLGSEEGTIDIAYISYTNFFDNPNDPVMEGDGVPLPDLQVLDYDSVSDGYLRYVTGHIVNNTSKTYSYVQVSIGLYNGDTLVGSTLDNVNNLAPGATWEFRALITSDNATQYRIEEVTGW